MPAATGAHVMRNASITVNGTEYNNQLTKARLVPDTPIQQQRTLVPDGTLSDVDSTTWTVELSAVSIWVTGGLAYALNEEAGNEVEVVLKPKQGSGQDMVTFTMIALPVEYGGEQGQWRMFEFTFPVVGSPTFSPTGA